MPFVPVPSTVEAEVRMFQDEQRVENTLHFRKVGAWDVTSMETLGDALIAWWTDQIAPIVSSGLSLSEVFLTDVSAADGPVVTRLPTTPTTGGNTAGPLPNNCTLCVSFRTAQRGRSFRGRNYLAGLCDNQIVGSLVQGTVVTAIQAAYTALIDVASGAECVWVVASKFHDGAPRTTGVPTPITSVLVVDNVIDSQRRRLPGRGR